MVTIISYEIMNYYVGLALFLCLCFLDCSDRVAMGRALDLPVYFGDAGSREVEQALELFMLVAYIPSLIWFYLAV